MIELTVKTLDSQNHQFSVEDDITVEQFKIKIAETVNVPADTQRIIYCGRVLQDSSKLADYDVHGKVVHLVQRAPPSNNPRPNNRSSPQPQRRGFRGFRGLEQGNTMYLGSMAFPGNLMESQGIVPPPPTYSLSGSRLNVAKRMMRRAEVALQLLENPSARTSDQVNSEENQDEEEVTPVIEARVIVPNTVEPIDQVLNAVQDTLLNATANAIPVVGLATAGQSSGASQTATTSAARSSSQSENSTPGGVTPRSSSSENLNSESRSENPNPLPENATRTSEMASLLTMLAQLQTRFAPFLEQYQNFMRDDPEVPAENQRQTQAMLNRVSEVFHFLGHAYHSLSDVIIRVRTPPPRPLLCRPILIQHSAVVQTGIPIQVEAQINLSADRPAPPPGQAAAADGPNGAATPTNTDGGGGAPPPPVSVQPGFVGLPSLPTGASMRVLSFPVEVRAVRAASAAPRTQSHSANNSATSASAAAAPAAGIPPPSSAGAAPAPPAGGTAEAAASRGAEGAPPAAASFNLNNPNVEFFMEVTPEGITIDSLETALVGSNQANDLLRGAMNGPPPEFLQSLMQMAGQLMNRNMAGQAAAAAAAGGAPAPEATAATPAAAPGQTTSTARGDTQTNPTTATHTRVTPRPHVHLAQQAMQGGFDPFLPCNSHHISRRRTIQHLHHANAAAATATATPAEGRQAADAGGAPVAADSLRGIANVLASLGVVNRYTRAGEPSAQAPAAGGSQEAASNASGGDSIGDVLNLPSIAALFAGFQGAGNSPDLMRQGPTLDQLLQDDQYVPGTSIITDLIMISSRNLTFVDLFTMNSGNFEPINRNVDELQNFFRTRICDGDTTPAGIDRGVDRLIAEMQPFLESFSALAVRGNIDMVRSAEQLFRQRLPNIISIAINLNANNLRLLLNQCLTTSKQLLALIVMASSEGHQGVEQMLTQVMNRFMQDVPQDIQNWTLMIGRVHLRRTLPNLSIPDSILQPYIVHKTDPTEARENESGSNEIIGSSDAVASAPPTQLVETMEVDDQELESEAPVEESEPLPNVVLGSESWHSQVPEDWVPIITRDTQRQRRQNSQGPFSDAYLSGMPSKRRKIVNNSKPQGSLPQVITDGVRQAVSATGLSAVTPLEAVAQAAGNSTEIQTAYRNLLRSTVQASLRENEDFTPERYPNIQNYFNDGKQ